MISKKVTKEEFREAIKKIILRWKESGITLDYLDATLKYEGLLFERLDLTVAVSVLKDQGLLTIKRLVNLVINDDLLVATSLLQNKKEEEYRGKGGF